MPAAVGRKPAPPDALKEPECHQAVDIRGKGTGKGAGSKKNEGDQKDLFAAITIAQVAHQRHHARHCNQID